MLIGYFAVIMTWFGYAWSEAHSAIGMSDVIFFALYLGAARSFGLRERLSAVVMIASFLVTLAVAMWWTALPALPLLSLSFLAVNADLLWRGARPGADARAAGLPQSSRTASVLTDEERHRLDVVRLREHVDGCDALEAVAVLAQLRPVAGQRRGVARHVDEAVGAEGGGTLQRLAGHARARRIDDHHGWTLGRSLALGVQRGVGREPEQRPHVLRMEVGVEDSVERGVDARRRDRLVLDLDGLHGP